MRQEDRDRLLVATARGVWRLLEEGPLASTHVTNASLELQAALAQAERSNERLTDAGMDLPSI